MAAPEGEPLDVAVLLPETWMNLSGDAVVAAVAHLPVEDPARDLLLLFDDVDLAFGRLRVRPKGGSAGHRGVAHVIERLGHSDFPRLRFGVGRPSPGLETADYVLTRFSPDEERHLPEALARAASAVEVVLLEGIGVAMNRFNADPAAGAAPVVPEEASG